MRRFLYHLSSFFLWSSFHLFILMKLRHRHANNKWLDWLLELWFEARKTATKVLDFPYFFLTNMYFYVQLQFRRKKQCKLDALNLIYSNQMTKQTDGCKKFAGWRETPSLIREIFYALLIQFMTQKMMYESVSTVKCYLKFLWSNTIRCDAF